MLGDGFDLYLSSTGMNAGKVLVNEAVDFDGCKWCARIGLD